MSQSSVVVEAIEVAPAVPMAIHTKWATVAVFGHELVSKRDLLVLTKCLTMPEWEEHDHGVRCVMFRGDNYPVNTEREPVLALAGYDSMSICINLTNHFERAVALANKEPERSVFACFNQILIQSYLHEMGHLSPRVDADERRKLDAEPDLNEEDAVEDFSYEMLFSLAKTTDIEPGLWMESPYFAGMFDDLLKDAAACGEIDSDWFKDQMWMLDNRVFYHLRAVEGENHPVVRNSLKGYIQLMDEKTGDSPIWDEETILDHVAGSVGQAMESLVKDSIPEDLKDPAAFVANAQQLQAGMTTPEGVIIAGAPEQPAPAAQQPLPTSTPDPLSDVDNDYVDIDEGVMEDNAGAPGTAFMMHGQQVGVNVQPDTPPVVQQQPTVAAAIQQEYAPPVADATEPTPPVQQQSTTLAPVEGMTVERTEQIMRTVYMKVYQHIFTHCQPSMQHGPERPFLFPEGAINLAVELTPEEQSVCFAMDCHDTAGRVCMDIPTTRGLVGRLDTKKVLPMYDMTFNYMGHLVKRRMVPQNPAKRKVWNDPASEYSAPALRAQQGAQIVHIFENDPSKKAANKAAKRGDRVNGIENGEFSR